MIFFLIGGLLCVINYFKIEISTNQEIYMSLAKWWADPSWIPNSFYFSDPAGTRIGFVALLAPFWKYFEFETVAMGATFINLFFLGGLLFLIAREASKLNFFFIALMHLTLFSGLGAESFYSGEWIFGGAEPKTFAYIFSLLGLLLFMRKKDIWAFLFLSLSAYFHVLIAGWTLLILLLDALYTDGFKRAFKAGLFFVAGIAPLFIYLLNSYFGEGVASFKGADEIFTFHLKNHLRPWLVQGREFRFWSGYFVAFLWFLFALWRFKKVDSKLSLLYRLSIYSFLIPAFFTFMAPWDWFTPFAKIFPFRLTMMQKILIYVAAGIDASLYLEKIKWKKPAYAFLSLIMVVSFGLRFKKNIIKRIGKFQDRGVVQLAEFIEKRYKPGTTVFYLDTNLIQADDDLDPLSRLSRTNVWFVNKFTPFTPGKILEWRRREVITMMFQEDPTDIRMMKEEGAEVVISRKDLDLRLVGVIAGYKVYDL